MTTINAPTHTHSAQSIQNCEVSANISDKPMANVSNANLSNNSWSGVESYLEIKTIYIFNCSEKGEKLNETLKHSKHGKPFEVGDP